MKPMFNHFVAFASLVMLGVITSGSFAIAQSSDEPIRVKIKTNINGKETTIDTILYNNEDYNEIFREFEMPDFNDVPDNSEFQSPEHQPGSFADKSHQRPNAQEDPSNHKKQAVTNGGALGVLLNSNETDDDEEGVKVQSILPGSAAEKAGLQAGDLILTVNDKELYSADELVAEIGHHVAGDVVTIEFMRNGKRNSTSVTLQEPDNKHAYTPPQFKMDDFFNQDFWNDNLNMQDWQSQMEDLLKQMEDMMKQIQPEGNEMPDDWNDFTPPNNDHFNDTPIPNPTEEINDLKVSRLSLAFNPTDKQIDLSFSLDNKAPIVVKLFDHAGNKIFEDELTKFNGQYNNTISLKTAPSSNHFFLQISQEGKMYNKKIETK